LFLGLLLTTRLSLLAFRETDTGRLRGGKSIVLVAMKAGVTGLIAVLAGCLIILVSLLAMVHNSSLCSSFVGCSYDYRAWIIPLMVGGTFVVEGVYALWMHRSAIEDSIEHSLRY
jgi:hypothetical protein